MMKIAPKSAHHYTEIGIKDESLDKIKLAKPLVGIRQTGFEDGNEIETETDEGHTGASNLDMGSYRKSAESKPEWEDGCRYGQGFEDYIYLMLPHVTINAHGSVNGVYDYVYEMPPNINKDLPVATIYHGFSKTETDARIFNNAMLNEAEFTMSADDLPKFKPKFVSDYNYVNCINPTRHLLDDHLARTVMPPHTSCYIGAVGASASEMLANPIDCFTEASWSLNHNAESQSCHGDILGVNTKTMGERELTGKISMPWVDRTKYFETEYECHEKYGHIVSEEITQKQVWYLCQGGNIIRRSDNNTLNLGEKLIKSEEIGGSTVYFIATGIPYRTLFKFPVVEVTKVNSPKSGNEAKDIEFEWKDIEQPTQSYMTVEITTDLSALHIDNTGVTRQECYPPLEDDQHHPINQEFAPFANQ